ncbi:MAG: DUF6600 domain-containing protein [Pyrinomonadaceae bacterium]
MQLTKKILWAFFFLMPLLVLNAGNAFANISDDEVPEIKARVARISFLRGDVQIKRADSSDWERATQNLPIVEGDEIVTDKNSRLEIQFNSQNYLRLSENAYLKITTLRDEGIAVSLPQGTLSLRVLEFSKERGYFEIDAPRTTIAVQKAGMYRVDAGYKNDMEVRVGVTDGGQARVYSEDSGFTLRNGKSARIYLDGNNIGEWETSDASRYADEFDSWALERDAIIAKRLRDAYYDKYYDRDIYGAEDLNDYGEWIYTKKYGYVWRPFRNATSSYANWSPYRYGHWRWIPPYGWTWVNDEPWGWATYHHGRWVYIDNDWAWTPYSYHRAQRSWWRPALVVVTYSGSLICWYPLPYNYNYYNYNHYSSTYVDRRKYKTTVINNTTVVVNPTPNLPPSPQVVIGTIGSRGDRISNTIPPVDSIPPKGVVGVLASDFGREKKVFLTAPPEVARRVLSETPSEIKNPPNLPTYKDLSNRISRDIRVENPKLETIDSQINTGAIGRKTGVSMDENLRQERIYGNRPLIERNPNTEEVKSRDEARPEIRDTGVVKRLPRSVIRQDDEKFDVKEAPSREIPSEGNPTSRSRREKLEERREDAPVYKPRKNNRDEELPSPRHEREERSQPPPKVEEPRSEPPPRREEHRIKPPSELPTPEKKPQERQPSPPLNEGRKGKEDLKDG